MTAQETGISVGKIVYTLSDGVTVRQYQGREILLAAEMTEAGIYITKGKSLKNSFRIDPSQDHKLESDKVYAWQFVYNIESKHPAAKYGHIYLGKYKV